MGRLTDYFGNGKTSGGGGSVGMGNVIGVEFTGVEHLDTALRQLTNIERETAVRTGLRRGGAYLIKQGRKRLRKKVHTDKKHQYREKGRKPGNLQSAFTNKLKRSKPGVLVGFRRPQGAHSHLVDLGTGERETHGGLKRGEMPGIKFWSDTREQDTPTAMNYVMDGIEKAALKIMR